jgi:anti-repressor protein
MQELIKVTLNQNNQQVVSARELHHFLGFSKTQVSRWIKSHILRNQYFEENVDYVRLDTDVEGVYDYALTLDMSKKLCMVSASKKGDEIRDYFIECEKQLKLKSVPQSYAQALLEAGRLALELETTQAKLIDAQPKVDFYDAVTDSMDSIDLGTAAKVLNMGFGRTTMFDKLRKLDVLMQSNTPYQKYIDIGWFRVIETKWQDKNGDTHIYFKTMIFQKGIDGIRKLLQNN